ncbi:MAG TPA: autotransporter-associated beta strand repeat-containing protein [Tepidisphaeraceae bacterium]|jgi:autotransporter-associated beta strand protein|nr:autotransporter-associated beta strand repeat-containing protein [Tepidisphaeraceae bacterium]
MKMPTARGLSLLTINTTHQASDRSLGMLLRRHSRISAAACAAAMLMCQSVYATDYSWTGNATGNWTDAVNWSPNTGTPVAGDTATFNTDGINAAETIFLNGNQAASSLTFNNTGTTTISTGVSGSPTTGQQLVLTSGLTVNSGAGAVKIGSASTDVVNTFINGSVTLTNNSGNTLVFGSGAATTATVVESINSGNNTVTTSGSGNFDFVGSFRNNSAGNISLAISGTGIVELDGSSSQFGAGTTLNSGTLQVKSSNALGTNATTFTINGGTYEGIGSARTLPAGVSLVIAGDCTLGQGTVGGFANTFAGSISLPNLTPVNITLNNSSTWLGPVTGIGGVTKAPSGTNSTTLTLGSMLNTYSGPTTIIAGTLTTTGSNMLSPNSSLILETGTTFSAINGAAQSMGSLSDGGGTGGTITMGSASADNLTIGNDNTNTSFSGRFTGSDPNANGGVIKVGTGTLTLTGASSFNGYLSVQNGTVAFNSIGNVGAASSALFAPLGGTSATAVNFATIAVGSTTTTGALQYIGATPASSDRVINMAGTTGGATLDSSGAGTLTLTSNLTATGAGAKALTLTGTNTGTNTLQGVIPDSSAGATTLVKSGTGNWIISGANTHSGGTTVNAGTLVVANASALGTGPLTLTGGKATLQASLGTAVVLPSISATSGTLDTTNNPVVLTTTDPTTVRGLLQTGYNAGAWNGSGIVSSSAAANSATAIGYALASDLGITSVGSVSVAPTSIVLKYTYFGDMNFDGKIDADDYALLDRDAAKNGLGSAATWTTGDFNYDGLLTSADYMLIDKAFALQSGGLSPSFLAQREAEFGDAYVSQLVASVPEPTSLSLIGVAMTGLLSRARRRRA